MEVDEERSVVSFENNTISSCTQNHKVGYESSVRLQFDVEGQVGGWGSGNYLRLGKYEFILTAAHVVSDGDIYILDGDKKIPVEVIYKNSNRDVAIVIPMEELSLKPRSIKVNDKENIVGEAINYTGNPSNVGQATFFGSVSKSDIENLIVQSFALPGSSGSVVFDRKGRVLGVVSAVSIAPSPVSPFPELIETVVYIERVGFLDKSFLREVFMDASKKR
jgi:S1-C subfamily serine protease